MVSLNSSKIAKYQRVIPFAVLLLVLTIVAVAVMAPYSLFYKRTAERESLRIKAVHSALAQQISINYEKINTTIELLTQDEAFANMIEAWSVEGELQEENLRLKLNDYQTFANLSFMELLTPDKKVFTSVGLEAARAGVQSENLAVFSEASAIRRTRSLFIIEGRIFIMMVSPLRVNGTDYGIVTAGVEVDSQMLSSFSSALNVSLAMEVGDKKSFTNFLSDEKKPFFPEESLFQNSSRVSSEGIYSIEKFPLVDFEKKTIGKLFIGISMEEFHKAMRDSTEKILLIIMPVLAVCLTGLYLISKGQTNLNRSLHQQTADAQAVSQLTMQIAGCRTAAALTQIVSKNLLILVPLAELALNIKKSARAMPEETDTIKSEVRWKQHFTDFKGIETSGSHGYFDVTNKKSFTARELRLLDSVFQLTKIGVANLLAVQAMIEVEIREKRAQLEELGRMALRLGDRIHTPLEVITLAREELEDLFQDLEDLNCKSDCLEILQTVQKQVDAISSELSELGKFKKYAPKDALSRDYFG